MQLYVPNNRALCHPNCVAVVMVAMMTVLLTLPTSTASYRLNTLEELTDLLRRSEDSSVEQRRDTEVWTKELPMMIKLLKSIDDWEQLQSRGKDADPERFGDVSSLRQSKRAWDSGMSGAMPPMRELCRMMGYVSCPH